MSRAVSLLLVGFFLSSCGFVDSTERSVSWSSIRTRLDPEVAAAISDRMTFPYLARYPDTWCGFLNPGPEERYLEESAKISVFLETEYSRTLKDRGEAAAMVLAGHIRAFKEKREAQWHRDIALFQRCIASINHVRVDQNNPRGIDVWRVFQ